ncbi:MAG: hypothetical protein JJU36_06000 [Phycisphaeraceae bacterium]|nr:hypothetical protein [Phycisphaeraceae bacterium]
MTSSTIDPPRFASVRPLVRYVDQEQAVVETHFVLHPRVALQRRCGFPRQMDVLMRITHEDGFNDEEVLRVPIVRGGGVTQMRLVRPALWWPVGMGDQSLYQVELSLLNYRRQVDTWRATIGLTSVRPSRSPALLPAQADPGTAIGSAALGGDSRNPSINEAQALDLEPTQLMINGQACEFSTLMPIDAPDERGFLPIAGRSLLVIRGHYGPDVLFEAADRAGILLLQCVPLDPAGNPDQEVVAQIDRLSRHPSLAGWYVGQFGQTGQRIAENIRRLDPTHCIFTRLPRMDAA